MVWSNSCLRESTAALQREQAGCQGTKAGGGKRWDPFPGQYRGTGGSEHVRMLGTCANQRAWSHTPSPAPLVTGLVLDACAACMSGLGPQWGNPAIRLHFLLSRKTCSVCWCYKAGMCLQMLFGESVVKGPASGLPSPDNAIVSLTEQGLLFRERPCLGKSDFAEFKSGTESSLVTWVEAVYGGP